VAGWNSREKHRAAGSGPKAASVEVPVLPIITPMALQVAWELLLWCWRGVVQLSVAAGQKEKLPSAFAFLPSHLSGQGLSEMHSFFAPCAP